MVHTPASGTNGAPPPISDMFKSFELVGKGEAAGYIVDAAAMIRGVKTLLHPIVVEDFIQSVERAIQMRNDWQKKPGPKWIYVTDKRRYREAAKRIRDNALTVSQMALQQSKSSQSSSNSSGPPVVNNVIYNLNLGHGFKATNLAPGTDHKSVTGTFTGSLVCPTDESSNQVFDEFLATVDKKAPDSGPDDLSSLNTQEPTPAGHPDEASRTDFSETGDVPEGFEVANVVGWMVLDDDQPITPQVWFDSSRTFDSLRS